MKLYKSMENIVNDAIEMQYYHTNMILFAFRADIMYSNESMNFLKY